MPNADMHDLFTEMLFGKKFRNVNMLIDAPAWIPIYHQDKEGNWVNTPLGPDHRKLFHDPLSAMMMGAIASPNNPIEGMFAGMFHTFMDTAFDGLHAIAQQQVKTVRKTTKKTKPKGSNKPRQ